MWKRLTEWLALTSSERKVILFLGSTVVVGLGIRLYQETFPVPIQFDYQSSDSTFAALSDAFLSDPTESEEAVGELINLNTATKKRLMSLPGIGEVIAERIMIYREDVGPFKSIDQLLTIKGMSKKKLERIREYITVH